MATNPQVRLRVPPVVDTLPNLEQLEAAIDAARAMLVWGDDWDGEGSPGYAEATWRRAADFLLHTTLQFWRRFHLAGDVPDIGPGPQGSLDLLWQTADYRLLLNVPADPAQLATYYGENSGGETVEGRLDISGEKPWLLLWMLK